MKYRLEELVDLQIGRTPPRKEFEWFNTNGDGYKWVSIKDMGNSGRFISDTSEYLTEAAQKRFGIPIVEKGTLLLSFKLTVGRLCITTDRMLTNEAIAQLPIKDTNIVDKDFLYYYLKNYNFHQLGSTSSIATAINSTYLKKMEIDLPPIDQQRAIAAVLSSIDDKIESNNAINNNLEQQALSIFYNLFASSDDSMETELGYIPRTFSVTKVGQLPMIVTDYVANGSFASLKENVNLYQEPNYAYFIRNTDLKADSFGVYVDKHSYEFLSKSALFGGEIIISNVGDVGSVHLCPVLDRPMTLGNNIIMLRPSEELRYYLYIWFKYAQGQSLIQGIKGGSAQPKFNKTDFKSLPIAIPNDTILCSFSSVVSPMFALINSNKMENNRLIKIRDSILPCLMTGEIDVSDVKF